MNLTAALNEHRVLILIGPTAVGKTDLSLKLAEALNADIISADSRQVYRYMDIGTAKPTAAELARVRHHFIDVRTPDQYYSAGEYGREARRCIDDLLSAGRRAIVVGGAGFSSQALVVGWFAPPLSDPAVKEKWRRKIDEDGKEAVFEFLRRIDPQTAERLHANDVQRVVRALEVYELTGRPISSFRSGEERPADFTPVFVGLVRERDSLRRRIEARVERMIADGLVNEVQSLAARGYSSNLNALRTVGYQEVFSFLNGELAFDQMIELIKTHSRRYAKRQLTWFRRDPRVPWLDLDRLLLTEACRQIESLLNP